MTSDVAQMAGGYGDGGDAAEAPVACYPHRRETDRQTVGRCAAHYHFEAHTCWMNRTGDSAVWAWHLGLNEDAWAGRWSEGGKSLGKMAEVTWGRSSE